MSIESGIATIWYEHYLLGIVIGRLKFCGAWFNSRSLGNYLQMGAVSSPFGMGKFPSFKSYTLEILPAQPKDPFIKDVREELEEFFSRYNAGTHLSAERAEAVSTLGKSIERRYAQYLDRIKQPWEDAIKIIDDKFPKVSDDLRSAIDCYIIGNYRASVAMARRTLEAILSGVGAVGEYLIDMIDDAEKKKIIRKNDKDAAHALRPIANRGIHVQDDGLDQIEHLDSQSVLEVVKRIIINIKIPNPTK